MKTAEAMAGCIGRECGKEMRTLVPDKTETTFNKPAQPKDEKSSFEMEKHKKELSHCCCKINRCEEWKAETFMIIKGQCSLAMKNKIKCMADCKTWEQIDGVIELLSATKELSFLTVDTQHEHWTVIQIMKNMTMMRQSDRESLAVYCKRFANTAEVTESQWGMLAPTKLMKKKGEGKKSQDKFLACVFLAGVDCKRCGRLVNDLNSVHVMGQKNCPTRLNCGRSHELVVASHE